MRQRNSEKQVNDIYKGDDELILPGLIHRIMERERPLEVRFVERIGEVAAGSSVIQFPQREELVPIIVPAGYPKDEFLATLTVRGISLSEDGVNDGDTLVCRRKFSTKDIGPETICIVLIVPTGELVAKKVIHNRDGSVTLRASGGGIKDLKYPGDEVEIRAIAFAVQKTLHNDRNRDKGIPF